MKSRILLSFLASAAAIAPAAAFAQDAGGTDTASAAIGDIIVTAQKREQALNDVGLTIVAATSATLAQRGVTDIGDLSKVVPGFNATSSPYATPVYTLRGIGLYDYSFGSSPSVAVYVDEIPRPFPMTQMGATLDVERVEVLKGPQGTLFGQSSTGGAINYIAAKPTNTFKAGTDLSYERFGKIDTSGFVSGPLTDTLKGRLAVRAIEGGAWQYSVSRPQDKNGDSRQLMGRLLLDWEASDKLRFSLNVNGVRDRSDTPQAQFSYNQLNVSGDGFAHSRRPDGSIGPAQPGTFNRFAQIDPAAFAALNNPSSPNYDPSFLSRQATVYGRLNGVGVPPGATILPGDPAEGAAYLGGPNGDGSSLCHNNTDKCIRQAEWSPEWPRASNDSYYQFALRTDFDLTSDITATSLTSYQKSKISKFFDNDATTARGLNESVHGSIKNFSQELRVAGRSHGLNWIVGGNYDWSSIFDAFLPTYTILSLNEPLPGQRFLSSDAFLNQTIKNYAIFANADLEVTSNLTLQGGARYTKSKRAGDFCASDSNPDQNLAKTFGNATVVPGFGFYDLQTALGLNPAGHRVVNPGQCYALNDVVAPTDPNFLRPTLDAWHESLNEHNISFRFGASYKFDGGALLYTTLSQGYKSGIISNTGPSTVSQYRPAVQEKVIAYEAGFKAPLFDRRAQLNAAGFYYDYRNKQVRARIRDNIFGLLEALVNVPKSYIWGFEAELLSQPVNGLTLSLSGSYLKTKVTGSFASVGNRPLYNQAGYTGDVKGSPLPFTPKFSGVFDGQYEASLIGDIKGFVGSTVTYTAKDNTTFHNDVLRADEYFRRAHTLLDIRAGLAASNGSWRLTAFGRNVTNQYYETTYFAGTDVGYRYAGRPRTYGLQLSVRTR